MKKAKTLLTYGILFLILAACTQKSIQIENLPRTTPEAEGVSSADILNFVNAVEDSKHEFHSFMFLRHGKVVAEGWWNPYKPELKHTLYSTSKSFTATAVGFAVSEKKLLVSDKVISFFPNDLPDTISDNLKELTVKDLLTMSVGQEPDPTGMIVSRDSNWVKGFLSTAILKRPGSTFLYNSMATYMLSAIVQKVTGEKVIDYLKPRLFDPLNIQGMDWEVDPRGINSGGWGLRLKTEDMAKFGQLFLQKGKWNGAQIIPAEWVEEASTFKIDQAPGVSQSKKDSSDWMQGYCYQMWRCRNNGFRADGAYGQYIIVLPEKDAVIAITCESPNMQEEINLVWKYLLPAIKDEKLSENKETDLKLKEKLSSLALPILPKANASPFESQIIGKTFSLTANEKKLNKLAFMFSNNECTVSFTIDTSKYDIAFSSGTWKLGETRKLGPSLVGRARAHFVGLPPSKIAANYTWNADTLVLKLRYIESPHSENIRCWFIKNKIMGTIENSQEFGRRKIELNGEAK